MLLIITIALLKTYLWWTLGFMSIINATIWPYKYYNINIELFRYFRRSPVINQALWRSQSAKSPMPRGARGRPRARRGEEARCRRREDEQARRAYWFPADAAPQVWILECHQKCIIFENAASLHLPPLFLSSCPFFFPFPFPFSLPFHLLRIVFYHYSF